MYEFVDRTVSVLKRIIPRRAIELLIPPYHALLALLSAAYYDFPARQLVVIGITGTKGKSTTAEMLFAILRAAGYKTALISTIRFAIDGDSEPNRYKMTLQGRGFVQMFLRRARAAGCTHAIIELTSESVVQYRHWFLYLDGLIVTNLQREHIESHGSFENYVAAKRVIVDALVNSPKPSRILVSNMDIPESRSFLSAPVPKAIGFTSRKLKVSEGDEGVSFEYKGMPFSLRLRGAMNAMNALAALKFAEALGVPLATIAKALAALTVIRGRMEHIDVGQRFFAVVDYAHTPDSLRALYGAFPKRRKICVLGNTGGGRDAWKRPEMGRIADEVCDKVILTNEDPYDEDPRAIVEAMARGMRREPEIIMDRREAIRAALYAARPGDAVLISGKGTDPYIMGAHGAKLPWNDADVVREELERLLAEHW